MCATSVAITEEGDLMYGRCQSLAKLSNHHQAHHDASDTALSLTSHSRTMEASTVSEAVKRGNAVVFFDVSIGGHSAGRIKIELFNDKTPKVHWGCCTTVRRYTHTRLMTLLLVVAVVYQTAENFRQLCTGEFKYVVSKH